ncbi:MAG: FtsX-like permease family protein [Euryarchaeota archaeon]|nr:FtsX-like permease family protein [Euryarchaeota archaeon]
MELQVSVRPSRPPFLPEIGHRSEQPLKGLTTMSTVNRSIRNVFRNKARTIVVIIIIGISIGVFLSMTIVNGNISARTVQIAEGLDTMVIVRPAGSYGPGQFGGGMSGGPPGQGSNATQATIGVLNESIVPTIETVAHVKSVQRLAVQMSMPTMGATGGRPSMGLTQGLDPTGKIFLFSGGTVTLASGRNLDASDMSSAVAIIGGNYSSEKSVGLGGSVDINGTSVQVVGIFTSGNRFGNNAVVVPYETLKAAYSIEGPSSIYVEVDSIGYMDAVENQLKSALGEDFDVVAASEMNRSPIQSSIESISANSQLGSIVALITAVVVMIFVMVLVTRERIREIGVLKAVGFKNSKIISQFLIESVTLASIGFVVGIALTMLAGPYIASGLLGASASAPNIQGPGGFEGRSFSPVSNIDFTLSLDLVLYALALTIALGIIGSLYPIIRAIKLKPAEALRYDE